VRRAKRSKASGDRVAIFWTRRSSCDPARKWHGKTQLYISQKANIGQGYISDLESGRRKGTTAALKKVAGALKIPLDLIA
jgi:predicted transcriptional regulator